MNRREAIVGVACGALGLSSIAAVKGAENGGKDPLEILTKVRSASKFSNKPVPEEDLKKIIAAGVNAPSGHNVQPWFFAAVTNRELLDEIDKLAGLNPGRLTLTGSPAAVFVCTDGSSCADFGAGGACGRMGAAAVLLGYGTKTIASPCKVVNEKYKEKLGIPENFNARAAFLVGIEETPAFDGVSGATERAPFEEKVSFVK